MPEHTTGRGYQGSILRVDLTSGDITRQQVPASLYQQVLSGVGLGVRYLWDNMNPGADPLGPDNILGMCTGLLTDTGSLFTGRWVVVGKSPQTGGWGDSNCGGNFSPYLKRSGVDAVFFHGASDKPVYLYLDENKAELLDASDLWGQDTIQTEALLKERHGTRCQVASIGMAGEKLSTMAGICNDGGRIAARSGLGAVMGSKKLKAVVAAGKTRVAVAKKDEMRTISKAFRGRLKSYGRLQKLLGDKALGATGWITRVGPIYPRQPGDLWRQLLIRYGTPALTAMSAESGDSPIKNWGGVGHRDFPLARSQKIGAESVLRHEVKKYGCYSCPIKCGGIVSWQGGEHPIQEMHKPEYETLCAFGSLVLNEDLESIFHINDLCNRAGIDTISCGGAVAFAVECFENGLLTSADFDGLEPRWGDGRTLMALVEKIIHRDGIGDVLADGVKRAAQRLERGTDAFAVHCGGVEVPMHDPKFDPGQMLSYTCDATPGRHTTACHLYLDLQFLEKKFSRAKKLPLLTTHRQKYRHEDKVEAMAVDMFYKMLVDGAGACLFGTQVGGDIPLCDWLNAATGWDYSHDDYLQMGERIHQLRHCFNVREGLDPARDFQPHPRLAGNPPQKHGPARGVTLDVGAMTRQLYGVMGWQEGGRPSRERLEALGLQDVARTLYSD